MKPPKCPLCKVEEWRHVCGASKPASKSPKPIASKPASKRRGNEVEGKGRHEFKKGDEAGDKKRTGEDGFAGICKAPKQRWSRAAYNAYMRVYMAVKAGRADWWPKRA